MPSVGGTRSEVGISAAATAIKLDRLAHKRRDKNKNSAKETVRRAQILQLIHKFCTNYCEAIDGTSAQVQEAARNSGELLGGAKINHIFRDQVCMRARVCTHVTAALFLLLVFALAARAVLARM